MQTIEKRIVLPVYWAPVVCSDSKPLSKKTGLEDDGKDGAGDAREISQIQVEEMSEHLGGDEAAENPCVTRDNDAADEDLSSYVVI